MNPLMGWSLAVFAAACAGCVGVFLWDLWVGKRTERRACAEALDTTIAPTEAKEMDDCGSCDSALTDYLDQNPHITVDLPNGETFVLVLGPKPLAPEELEATRRFLALRYGPVTGTHFYFLVLDAYTAYAARDLDTELAHLGEIS